LFVFFPNYIQSEEDVGSEILLIIVPLLHQQAAACSISSISSIISSISSIISIRALLLGKWENRKQKTVSSHLITLLLLLLLR